MNQSYLRMMKKRGISIILTVPIVYQWPQGIFVVKRQRYDNGSQWNWFYPFLHLEEAALYLHKEYNMKKYIYLIPVTPLN